MCIPDPAKPGFEVTDLSLPKSVSQAAVESRSAFLHVVDRHYRALNETAEHTNMDAFTAQAWKMILTPAVRDAFDLSKESDKMKERYGKDSIGQSLSAGAPAGGSRQPFRYRGRISLGNSWDTHSDNDKGHRDRLTPPLDRTLTALVDDLDERGLLESTLVIAMGEFGRTPIINANLGRDHWPNCWSLALAGGGIKTGQVVGASDERGANVTDRVVSMGDLYATIYQDARHRLEEGIHEPDRPAAQDRQFAGRPDRLACEGIAGIVLKILTGILLGSQCGPRMRKRRSSALTR